MAGPVAYTWQAGLFGTGPATVDAGFSSLQRRPLGSGAWVDLAPGWLNGADGLFHELASTLPWQSRDVEMYGRTLPEPRMGYRWSFAEAPDGGLYRRVEELAAPISERYGVELDSVGCNFYRDGRDSVAFHADRHARGPDDPDVIVAIVSLGSPRRFLLRPRHGGRQVALRPGPGDLLVMGGSCQRTWQHSIPKQAAGGPRISVTFRHPPR